MKNKILLGVSGVKGVKTIVFLFLCLLMILPLSSCYNKENREEILKVYNWADYIDEDVLANFPKWYEQQTGKKIRVIYQTFDINEVMLTKIERGHEDYDVVCPSEYIIERMLRKDLLLPIDTAFGKTPNYISNVSPYIVEQIDATSNNGRIAHHYAVPYMWGTCGILYNKVHVPINDAQTWGTLWDRKYQGKERAESSETKHRRMGSRLRQGDHHQKQSLSQHDLER
jgi:spermidine/putrescine transport system substrate-binding protein